MIEYETIGIYILLFGILITNLQTRNELKMCQCRNDCKTENRKAK